MKRIIGFLLISCVMMAGCQTEGTGYEIQKQRVIPTSDRHALENVITSPNSGEIENIDRFYVFLDNVTKQQKDRIRVISYTTEGDPIYQDLEYDGETIDSTIDSSRDKYGSGGTAENTCTEVKKEENVERIDYFLAGCKETEESFILVVRK